MKVNIISKEEKPLLSRTEILADLSYTGKTPSKDELRREIISSQKATEKLVCVHKITPIYGKEAAKAEIYIYKNEADMKEIEPTVEEEKKPAEKKEEKPAETKAPKEKKE